MIVGAITGGIIAIVSGINTSLERLRSAKSPKEKRLVILWAICYQVGTIALVALIVISGGKYWFVPWIITAILFPFAYWQHRKKRSTITEQDHEEAT